MNFGKAKKILIFLFLFLNLFLIYQLVQLSDAGTSVSKESIEKATLLAQQKGLNVQENAIPKRVEVLSFLELSNPLNQPEEFKNNFTIKEFSSKEKFSMLLEQNIDSQSSNAVLKVLKKAGFKAYNLSFDREFLNPITKETTYRFVQTYNSFPITGAYIDAAVKNNMLLNVTGNVYRIEEAKVNDYTPVSPLKVIIDISASLNQKKAALVSFSQGYYIPQESKYYQNLTAVPCYVATFENNKKAFYSAEDGTFLMFLTEDGGEIYDKATAFLSL